MEHQAVREENERWVLVAGISAVLAALSYVGVAALGALGYVGAIQYVAIVAHLLLLPVVACLPAPEWARAAGYGWIVVDNVLAVAAIEGVPYEHIEAMRHGLHIATAVWIFGASLGMQTVPRFLGLFVSFGLLVMSFADSQVPFLVSRVILLTFVIWLVTSGVQLYRSAQRTRQSN